MIYCMKDTPSGVALIITSYGILVCSLEYMGHTHTQRNKHFHQRCIFSIFRPVMFLQLQRLFIWFLLICMKVILIMSVVYFSNAFVCVCVYILLFYLKIYLKNCIFIKLLWYKEWNNNEQLIYKYFARQLWLLLGFEVICTMTILTLIMFFLKKV